MCVCILFTSSYFWIQVQSFLHPPMEGVVLQTYGAGNGPTAREDLIDVLKEASDAGIIIVNITQCAKGTVSPVYEAGKVSWFIRKCAFYGHDLICYCACKASSQNENFNHPDVISIIF